MRKGTRNKKKEKMLEELSASRGIIKIACDRSGISRNTFYEWIKQDLEFKKAVDIIQEEQIDFVESRLLDNINEGDTQASTFYLKTKGKGRGYTERDIPQTSAALVQNNAPDIDVMKLVQSKIDELTALLKEQGRYSSAYNIQIKIAAQLCVKTDMLFEETLKPNHKAINVQISREGNERETISATESLYKQYAEQCQTALRALGLNTDGKKIEIDDDSFDRFFEDMNREEE